MRSPGAPRQLRARQLQAIKTVFSGSAGAGSRESYIAQRLAAEGVEGFRVVPALDEEDPAWNPVGLAALLPLLGVDGAGCDVGDEEMRPCDARPLNDLGKQTLGEGAAMIFRRGLGDIIAPGGDEPALGIPEGAGDPADRARDIAEMADGLEGPRRGIVQPARIILPREGLRRIDLVEGEIFRAAMNRHVATPAEEAGNPDSLGHMLPAVPGVEDAPPFRRDIVPDRNRALSRQAHLFPPSPSASGILGIDTIALTDILEQYSRSGRYSENGRCGRSLPCFD